VVDELKLPFALGFLIVMALVHQGGGGDDEAVRLEVTQPAFVRLDGALEIVGCHAQREVFRFWLGQR
jgi:hypothetical protein